MIRTAYNDGPAIAEMLGSVKSLLRPRESVSVSEWAARHRVLTLRHSSSPGRWNNERAPYLVGIMDAFSNPDVREISVMKSAQVGGTEVLFNMLGWAIDIEPGPTLYVYPNELVARRINKDRLLPALKSIDRLQPRFTGSRQDENSLQIRLDAMDLYFAGSNSESNLENVPCRYVFVDELDRCAPGTREIVAKRTETFPDCKRVNVGTPGNVGVGIDEACSKSTALEFYVPCPHCEELHVREFAQVKWEGGLGADPQVVRRTAWFECPACHERIDPVRNLWQLRRGRWLTVETAEEPVDVTHLGFHIRGLLSPFTENPYGAVAEGFVKAQGRPSNNWTNRTLGEAYEPRSDKVRIEVLRDLCKPVSEGGYELRQVPQWVVALTLAIDVQQNEVYLEARGWGEEGRDTCSIWHDVVEAPEGGDLKTLDHIFDMGFPYVDTGEWAPIRAWAIDCGYRAEEVYNLCLRGRSLGNVNVWPIRGDGQMKSKPYAESPLSDSKVRAVRESGLKQLRINADHWKDALVARIRGEQYASLNESDEELQVGRFALPCNAGDEYLSQLTAEHRVPKMERGREVFRWEPRPGYQRRNHWFDTAVYNLALADKCGVRFLRRIETTPPPAPPPSRTERTPRTPRSRDFERMKRKGSS